MINIFIGTVYNPRINNVFHSATQFEKYSHNHEITKNLLWKQEVNEKYPQHPYSRLISLQARRGNIFLGSKNRLAGTFKNQYLCSNVPLSINCRGHEIYVSAFFRSFRTYCILLIEYVLFSIHEHGTLTGFNCRIPDVPFVFV